MKPFDMIRFNYNWKPYFFLFLFPFFLQSFTLLVAQDHDDLLNSELRAHFSQTELLLVFQGKGSCLPYDAGVLDEAYRRIDSLRKNRVIVAGNSSGSIPAAFFCCYGFTDGNVQHAIERLKLGDRNAVRNMEDVSNKFSKIAQGRSTEISHLELREYIAFALGVRHWENATSIEEIVRRSDAKPRFPCLIVAANREVLDNKHPEGQLTPAHLKELDPTNMDVSWRQEIFDYYTQYPERFATDHPHLKLGPTRRIGKAVTFFVDPSMYALLSQIPENERTADLRLMTTAEDVATAILASVSEPSYFPAVAEDYPEKILQNPKQAVTETIRQRSYIGGYIISMPAQDVRRMLPGIRVLGTGWRHNPLVARLLLKSWLLADCEEIAFLSEYWSDLEVNPDYEFESHIEVRDLTGSEEFEFGRRRAKELLDKNQGFPAFVNRPKYDYPAEKAIMPQREVHDMFLPPIEAASPNKLRTMRGF